MVSFVKIVMSLALLTVAAASPVTSTSPILGGRTALNGCYGSGPTFADVGFGDSGFIDGACNSLKGGYSSGQRRNYCVNGAHGRINMAAIRFGNKPGADLSYESCRFDFETEYFGCSHGSEQDHDEWHWIIDPNYGAC